MKALSLFSGGLDSAIAVKIIQNQGITVIPLNFVSHFFGGFNERAEKMAEQLGVKVKYIDFKEEHLQIVDHPPSGYGKCMNPCIDCHALMIRKAIGLLEQYGASFVITGEVLGQRPMSQTKSAIHRINRLSGWGELVVRPLSGQLLPETLAERNRWICREKLLEIQGRGRKKQMELAAQFGITEYPTPAGGCPLTEPQYSRRLRMLQQDGCFQETELFELIAHSRIYRLDEAKYFLIGRNREENELLTAHHQKKRAVHFITADKGTMGPDIFFFGERFSEGEIHFAKRLFARYSHTKGKSDSYFLLDGKAMKIGPVEVTEEERLSHLIQ